MSFDSGVGDLNDGELEKFLNVEKVKTQFHEQEVIRLINTRIRNLEYLKNAAIRSDNIQKAAEKILSGEMSFRKFAAIYNVHRITDICWDKCIDKLGAKIDGKSHACMVNCVERFIDSTLLLTKRFANMLQSHA